MMKRIKKHFGPVLLIIIGITMLILPLARVSSEPKKQASMQNTYEGTLRSLSPAVLETAKQEAKDYNKMLGDILIGNGISSSSIAAMNENYSNLLNVNGDGIMGYLSIPKLDVVLPIFHQESTRGASHLLNTSLPVGGTSTHSVLAAHSGLSSSRQFTDLVSLEEGDIFMVSVLGDELYYQVDQIRTVEPDDTSELRVIRGGDYMTLLTCTPYGVNSHRLLVRGRRAEEAAAQLAAYSTRSTGESVWYDRYIRQLLIGIVVDGSLLLGAFVLMRSRNPKVIRLRRILKRFPRALYLACRDTWKEHQKNGRIRRVPKGRRKEKEAGD